MKNITFKRITLLLLLMFLIALIPIKHVSADMVLITDKETTTNDNGWGNYGGTDGNGGAVVTSGKWATLKGIYGYYWVTERKLDLGKVFTFDGSESMETWVGLNSCSAVLNYSEDGLNWYLWDNFDSNLPDGQSEWINTSATPDWLKDKKIRYFKLTMISPYNIDFASADDITVKIYKDTSLNSTVTVNYVDASTGLDVAPQDVFENVTPGSHTYNAKDIQGYSVEPPRSQTINVPYVNSVTFYYDKNGVPKITLNAPGQVVAGDDVPVSATSSSNDPNVTTLQNFISVNGANGSPITGEVVKGNSATTSGTVWFPNIGTYGATATVIDNLGGSASDSKQINVIKPTPVVNFTQTGALKENRKVVIDMSKSYAGSKRSIIDWAKAKYTITALNGSSMNDVRIQSHTSGSTNGTVLYDPTQGINQSLDGISIFDMSFRKTGKYQISCTLTNDYGVSTTGTLILDILEDKPPVAGFSAPTIAIRDQYDPNKFSGLKYSILTLNDSQTGTSGNYSTDGDIIDKIAWFYIFDANNNGSYLDDNCYVYNSSTAQWQYVGTYSDITNFDVDSVPVGALRSVNIETPHVGDYYYGVKIREAFGEEYIPQFVKISDRKTAVIFK